MTRALASARWYIAAGAVALLGLAGALSLVLSLVFGLPEPVRFVAPGELRFTVPAAGRYVLWNEHRTLFEGRSYDVPATLPNGVDLEIQAPGGERVRPTPSRGATWKSGEAERASVAEFEARVPGEYRIIARGAFAPRVLSVAPAQLQRVFLTVGGAIACAVLGLGAALALGLYGFLEAQAGSGSAGMRDEARLAKIVALAYGLQALALLVGVTLFAAVMIGYAKRAEVAGTWLESHVRWQIRTFWWTFLWTAIGLSTVVVGIGVLVLFAVGVWFVYRVVKGWLRLEERRPLE